jgi:vitamin B12 transporter
MTFAVEHEEDEATTRSIFSPSIFDRSIGQTGFVGLYQLGLWDDLFLTGSVRHDINDLFGEFTTYRATGAYTIDATGTKLRASYGTGIKNPTLFELYGDSPTYTGNADLEPERAKGWDVGVDQVLFGDRLLIEATYFNQRISNLIQLSGPTSENLPGISDIDGIELAATVRLIDDLTLRAAYTWLDGEAASGEPLMRRPDDVASIDVNYAFLDGRANVNLGVVYTGTQFDTAFDAMFNPLVVELDSYVLVNLRGSYQVNEHTQFYARIENLLDEEYEDVFSYGGTGRTAIGGVRVRF